MRLLSCILLAVVAGCRSQRQQSAPVHAVREHRVIALDVAGAADTSLAVRDLFSGEPLRLERRGALLVLVAPAGVIDTMSVPATRVPHERTLRQVDSSFVQLTVAAADSLVPRTADLIGVADGALHWSARLPVQLRLPGAESLGVYATTATLLRSPLAMTGNELFRPSTIESGAPEPWRHPFDLRFDDSAYVFYNVSVALDSVPFADGAPAVTGRHPGIALSVGTSVMIGREWYALSLPEDLDPAEFARGTVGLVLEGRGEWGDTLRPLTGR